MLIGMYNRVRKPVNEGDQFPKLITWSIVMLLCIVSCEGPGGLPEPTDPYATGSLTLYLELDYLPNYSMLAQDLTAKWMSDVLVGDYEEQEPCSFRYDDSYSIDVKRIIYDDSEMDWIESNLYDRAYSNNFTGRDNVEHYITYLAENELSLKRLAGMCQ